MLYFTAPFMQSLPKVHKMNVQWRGACLPIHLHVLSWKLLTTFQ